VHPTFGANPPGLPLRPGLSGPRRATISRSTQMAMLSPILRTGCDSRPPQAGDRLQRYAASTARRPQGRARNGRSSRALSVLTRREAQAPQAGDYHFFVGRRSDPFFFDAEGASYQQHSPRQTAGFTPSLFVSGRSGYEFIRRAYSRQRDLTLQCSHYQNRTRSVVHWDNQPCRSTNDRYSCQRRRPTGS